MGLPERQGYVSQTPDVTKRDALGWACFLLHVAILIFILTGWAIRPVLVVYLVFLPLMALHWQVNKDTCVLNNLESLIRTGRWRNPDNCEEGAWLERLIYRVTGLDLSVATVNRITYTVMVLLWGLALWHLAGW